MKRSLPTVVCSVVAAAAAAGVVVVESADTESTQKHSTLLRVLGNDE